MSLSEIITDSVKYPFNDLTKFFIVGIISLLAGMSNVFTAFDVDSFALVALGGVISLIFTLILSGYSLSVINYGIRRSDEIPDFDFVKNFIDGIKVLIIEIVYFIIPLLITIVLAFITGAIGQGLDHLAAGLGVGLIISFILIVLFSLFEFVALARFAKTEEFGDAFNFSEIFEEIKQIGIVKILALVIISLVIMIIAAIVISLIGLVPFIGIIIADIIIGAFVTLYFCRAIGLLYAEA
ncbi:DUF4013 domain-containing protein [Methanobrevibacter sp.]